MFPWKPLPVPSGLLNAGGEDTGYFLRGRERVRLPLAHGTYRGICSGRAGASRVRFFVLRGICVVVTVQIRDRLFPSMPFAVVAAPPQQDGGEDACYFVEHRALRRSWVQIPPAEMP